MKALRVTIDRKRRAVSFEGPGTFEAKETIRTLGPARWFGDRKVWEVAPVSADEQQIKALFTSYLLEINELAAEEDGAASPTAAEAVVSSAAAVVESLPAEAVLPAGVPSGIGVSQLLVQVRGILRSAFPQTILIKGVLAQVKRSAGRVYLDLADEEKPDERINGVIWQGEQQILEPLLKRGFQLEKDLPVMFEAAVELSRRDGRLTLSIRAIVAEFTVAKLQAQRDITNRRLKDEGLFERNRTLALPILPRRLGILTSSAGTVINDFRSSLDAGKFGFELFWRHSAMQGLEAKPQILAGLKALSEFPGLDAILVFRGGGSAAELAIFNDYEIARAVCLAPVPVISAIGHQEDQCSVQDVSFRGLGVPKDVGRFFADIVIERRRSFASFCERISGLSGGLADQTAHRFRLLVQTVRAGAQSALDRPAQFIAGILQQLPVLISRNIAERAQRMSMICGAIGPLVERSCDHGAVAVKGAADRLARQVRQQHDRAAYSVRLELDRLAAGTRMAEIAAERVAGFERLFEQVSPERQLKRGFAMVRKVGGEFVLQSGGVAAGDEVEIEFHDGRRSAKISK